MPVEITGYWLAKTEPHVYSIDDFARDGETEWDGVRNYQVRNFMRDRMNPGEKVLIYHSNTRVLGVYGVAETAISSRKLPSDNDMAAPRDGRVSHGVSDDRKLFRPLGFHDGPMDCGVTAVLRPWAVGICSGRKATVFRQASVPVPLRSRLRPYPNAQSTRGADAHFGAPAMLTGLSAQTKARQRS